MLNSRSSFPPATSTAAASFSLRCRCRRRLRCRRIALSPLVSPTMIPISCSRTSTRFGSSATEATSTRSANAAPPPCSTSRWSAPTSRYATRCSARSTSSAARLDAATSSDFIPSSELPPPTSRSSLRTWTGGPPTPFSAAAVAGPLWRPSLARPSSALRSYTPARSCTATSNLRTSTSTPPARSRSPASGWARCCCDPSTRATRARALT